MNNNFNTYITYLKIKINSYFKNIINYKKNNNHEEIYKSILART